MRGSGGVSAQLEQIARIVDEQGYWKPRGHVPNYYRQDVYHLGQSAQRLFDEYTVLDRRIEQLQAHLSHIKQCKQIVSDTTPQEMFEDLAVSSNLVSVQNEVDAIVQLLGPIKQPRWFQWFFVQRGRNKICHAV